MAGNALLAKQKRAPNPTAASALGVSRPSSAPKSHDQEQWLAIALDVVFDSNPVDFGLGHPRTVVVVDDFPATGPHLRATGALRW